MPTNHFTPRASLSAVAATGAGTAIVTGPWLTNTNSIGVFTSTTGTPATIAINIEVLVGAVWYPIAGAQITATATQCVNVSLPAGANQVRANLITLTGGTSPTVTALIGYRVETQV